MRPEQIDETGVNVFAIAMKNKMRVMRERGKEGWYDSKDCEIHELITSFCEQVAREERDWVDIGNYAMMIWNRQNK
jgi:hypothetical protein